MSRVVGCIAALPVPAFPAAVEARCEAQNRTVWNELEHASEERELVYEDRLDCGTRDLAAFFANQSEGPELHKSCLVKRTDFTILPMGGL